MRLGVEVPSPTNWTLWFVGILVAGLVGLGFYASYERQQFKITSLTSALEASRLAEKQARDDLTTAQSANASLVKEIETLKKLEDTRVEVQQEHVTKVEKVVKKAKLITKALPAPVKKDPSVAVDPAYEARSAARVEALWAAYCLQPTDASLCPEKEVVL